MKIAYPAVFRKDGDTICIRFPDLQGAFSEARQGDDPIVWAKDCLELYLRNFAKLGWSPAKPSPIDRVACEPELEQVVLVEVEVEENTFAKKIGGRPKKKQAELASRSVVVRMTDDEFQELEALAKREGTSKSALIKRFLRDATRKIT